MFLFNNKKVTEVIIKTEEKSDTRAKDSMNTAKEISEKYAQLSSCCSLLSKIKGNETDYAHLAPYANGWSVSGYSIRDAGIDKQKVYDYIEKLAKSKKDDLERDLSSL